MPLDATILQEFEAGLDPSRIHSEQIPFRIIGTGEISTILEINDQQDVAAKRMPLFQTEEAARSYTDNYIRYCDALRQAGLNVPADETCIVKGHGGLKVLYILQPRLAREDFCHVSIHKQTGDQALAMLDEIVDAIEKVWRFNAQHASELELAIDGQLSNWAKVDDELLFIDTSTPLMRIEGEETLDPELLLQSAPGFLKWIIRLFFLQDVMERYYSRELVYTDLIANLFKEGAEDHVPDWVARINQHADGTMAALDESKISAYYREDKLIWRLFLGLRKFDRFLSTGIMRKRYEFILPGKIER